MRLILFFATAVLAAATPASAQVNDTTAAIIAGFDHIRARVETDLVFDVDNSNKELATAIARQIFVPIERFSRTRECRAARMRIGGGKAYFQFDLPKFTDTGATVRTHITSGFHRPRPYLVKRSITVELTRTEHGFEVAREIGKEFRESVISDCGG